MKTLEDAWAWYESARSSLELIRRLGDRYWDELPWDGRLGLDGRIVPSEGTDVAAIAKVSLDPLDDLAVLVLFSVFEGEVRDRVLKEVQSHQDRTDQPRIRQILEGTLESIASGSFFKVLELFKVSDKDLVEQVNQVRRYRNWVAHGRRTDQPAVVDPKVAIDRLRRFLKLLGSPEGEDH